MTIQVNTDNNIDASESTRTHISEIVNEVLGRFDEHITRVEVHLKDINGSKDKGVDDVHCGLEVRVKGLDPILTSSTSDNIHKAVKSAADKMKLVLDKTNKIRQEH